MNQQIAQPRFYFPPNLVQFFKPRPYSKNNGYDKKKNMLKYFVLKKKIQLRKFREGMFREKSLYKIIIIKKKEFKLNYNISFGKKYDYFLVTNLIPDFLGEKFFIRVKKHKENTSKIYFSLTSYNWIKFWGLIFLKLKYTINTIKKEIKFFSKKVFPNVNIT